MEDASRLFTAMWNVRYGNAICEDAEHNFFVCVALVASNCISG